MVSLARIWEDTFEGITGTVKLKGKSPEMKKRSMICGDGEEDEAFLEKNEETKLECPICFEPFDMSENAPLVLWCGHTLCKSCVLRLQRAVLRLQRLLCPIVLPFFVSCPWCSSLSLKLSFKGHLKFPKKNYYVMWMIGSSQRVSCAESNNLSCVGSNAQSRSDVILGSNQEELLPDWTLVGTWIFLGSIWKSLFGYSAMEQLFRLTFLVIFAALYAARVGTLLLSLYALTALFGSAFLLLPKLSLPVQESNRRNHWCLVPGFVSFVNFPVW
ncbi:PREDICTED: uncharacterized protein LOC104801358 [Tarenaya hassleriana]|uniref:uncharacterized protein LOC104801358 n=1 Tax=Tarenaya hassleriana TaxID=28532 RepID=UPI00053C9D30|nr:PREDICTED: uncharacterized protein LOC104801358 [Tarenaya hassleriana]XP_010522913.1 PREDICTED: uncharacterized protein LOC104801358 [Tarenaya hassleriana]XP_019056605.1 PREDICTED: uncharacterized protein LOC104801358 [Tarenaya hassleriana]